MGSRITARDEEMARGEALPQADASSLVDADKLEVKVKTMYGQVAREKRQSFTSRSDAVSPSASAIRASCSTRYRARR
jgi:hypothetical protein